MTTKTVLTFFDYYNSLLDEDKKMVRNQFLADSGISYPGFYKKLKDGSFTPLELDALASEVAQADLQQCGDRQQLALPALAALSPPRRHNLLRYWLGLAGLNAEQEQLHELWRQMSNARSDSAPLLQLGPFSLRRYRQQLYLLPMQSTPPAAMVPWPCWPQPLLLADGRQLQLRAGGGLRLPHADEPVSVRFALPGSLRCWPAGRSRSRELSKLWQEYGVPPWQRPQLPMLADRVTKGRDNHDYVAQQLNASDWLSVPQALAPESRAPDSIQFSLVGEWSDEEARAFQAEAKKRGVPVQIFGLSEGNARAFWNWQFLGETPELPMTRAMLMRACDMRLPVRLSREDLDYLAEAVLAAVRVVKG